MLVKLPDSDMAPAYASLLRWDIYASICIVGRVRPTLTKLRAITSTTHLKVKFPTPGGVGEINGDREMDGRYYIQALVLAEAEPENRK